MRVSFAAAPSSPVVLSSGCLQSRNAKRGRIQCPNNLRGSSFWRLRLWRENLAKQDVLCSSTEGSTPFTDLDSDVSGKHNLVCDPRNIVSEESKGKPGFVSFHGFTNQREVQTLEVLPPTTTNRAAWFLGPTILVALLVLPSLYLRRVISAVFEDSLLTDFLILFFTEALFYGGVAIFALLVDHVWRPVQQSLRRNDVLKPHILRLSSVVTLILSLIIPLLTMGMVWPWTGPAASAALAPYLAGIVVQFAFEEYARRRESPAWPTIPVVFQIYRLHQLNRASQLVTALTFSVKGAESSAQSFAITRSLSALLIVLQVLGVICIWSLSSFLMRFLPSTSAIESKT